MPKYDDSGRPLNNSYVKIAASATTAQLSVPSDVTRGRDYLDRIIITAASSAAPGAVTVFDGTVPVLVHAFASGAPDLLKMYEVNLISDTTKGFNVTTGTSVSVVCVGRFGG